MTDYRMNHHEYMYLNYYIFILSNRFKIIFKPI